jgi:antitoxin ParD1/3/4
MTITLPDEMREELERKAQAGGFTSVEDYFVWLAKSDGTNDLALSPEDLGFRSQDELEARLLSSLASGPPVLATPEFWAELRKEASARAGGKS